MEPLISLVIPVYNVEKYLDKCMQTVLTQTYENLEVILVDDGSTDNSGKRCDMYAAVDSRVKTLHQKNSGVSVARNVGIDESCGEYLMFVDPDDWLELDCCEQALAMMQEQKCDIVMFDRYKDIGNTCLTNASIDSCRLSKEQIMEIQLSAAIAGDDSKVGIFTSRVPYCKLIKRSVITEKHLKFVPGLKKGQDNVFALYLYESIESAYYFNYKGYHYRINGDSVGHKYNEKMPEYILALMSEFKRFVEAHHRGDERYAIALGKRCYTAFAEVEVCFLFHREQKPKKAQAFKIIRDYFESPVIKQYSCKCKWSEFVTTRKKIRFILLKYKFLNLYYLIMKIFYSKKLASAE